MEKPHLWEAGAEVQNPTESRSVTLSQQQKDGRCESLIDAGPWRNPNSVPKLRVSRDPGEAQVRGSGSTARSLPGEVAVLGVGWGQRWLRRGPAGGLPALSPRGACGDPDTKVPIGTRHLLRQTTGSMQWQTVCEAWLDPRPIVPCPHLCLTRNSSVL